MQLLENVIGTPESSTTQTGPELKSHGEPKQGIPPESPLAGGAANAPVDTSPVTTIISLNFKFELSLIFAACALD